MKAYLELYKASTASKTAQVKKVFDQHKKELQQAKTSTVSQIANILTVQTMLECGQQVPEELEEGAKHFSECLERLQGKVQGTIHWRQERDYLIKQLNKLVSASKDTINHTDITYEDFGTAVAESISSNSFPEVITCKKAAES